MFAAPIAGAAVIGGAFGVARLIAENNPLVKAESTQGWQRVSFSPTMNADNSVISLSAK